MSNSERPHPVAVLLHKIYRRIGRTAPSRAVVGSALEANPSTTGKLLPQCNARSEFIAWPVASGDASREPVPPVELWEGYAETAEDYLASGERDIAILLRILMQHCNEVPAVVLDLGCAAGRMIRHFPSRSDSELWGLDINARHIGWCQAHLERINFAAISSAPHLPFEDAAFDLVYCGSVFTHISDLADAWLLEIRRVLKPGGLAYLTVHDLESYEQLFTTYADKPLFAGLVRDTLKFEARWRLRGSRPAMFSYGADPASQVFYDRDFICRKWGRWMRVLAYEPQVHDHQSALLLQKHG